MLPIYILHGEEPFFIDEIVKFAEESVLSPAERAFNLSVLYGKEVNFMQILDHARQYPMMSQRRLVIIKQAQQLKDWDRFSGYFSQPSPQSLVIFAFSGKKIDGRQKWFKTAKSLTHVGVFHSEKIRDYKLGPWLDDFLRQRKRRISPKANQLMCDYLGNDIKKLVNELDKLELNLGADENITEEHVDRFVGISKDFNVFELLSAIGTKRVKRAFTICHHLRANIQKNPLQMLAPAFFQYFQKVYIVQTNSQMSDQQLAGQLKVNPFFMKEYRKAAHHFSRQKLVEVFQHIQDTDARSKGVGNRRTQPGELLLELVSKILMD